MKVIQRKAVKKKRENDTKNRKQSIRRRRKRNIGINIENYQKTPIVTVIQDKSIQRRRGPNDEILIIYTQRERNRQSHRSSCMDSGKKKWLERKKIIKY